MPLAKKMASKGRLDFEHSLTRPEIESLVFDTQLKVLQTRTPADSATWKLLNDILFAVRPEIELRLYGFYSSECDLSFLRDMTNVRHFSADYLMRAVGVETIGELKELKSLSIGIYNLENFDFLETLPERFLNKLSLGATKSKKPTLSHIARFSELRKLHIEGQQKDIQAIVSLAHLEDLALRSVTLNDLSFLKHSNNLWSLDIKLGGTNNLAALAEMQNIKYLELWQIRGLKDVSAISAMHGLQYLFLQSLPHISALPDLSELHMLRRIHLENMKNLADITQLAKVPALEELMHCSAHGKEPAQYEQLLERDGFKRVFVGFGSQRKNKELLRLAAENGVTECKRNEFLFV